MFGNCGRAIPDQLTVVSSVVPGFVLRPLRPGLVPRHPHTYQQGGFYWTLLFGAYINIHKLININIGRGLVIMGDPSMGELYITKKRQNPRLIFVIYIFFRHLI